MKPRALLTCLASLAKRQPWQHIACSHNSTLVGSVSLYFVITIRAVCSTMTIAPIAPNSAHGPCKKPKARRDKMYPTVAKLTLDRPSGSSSEPSPRGNLVNTCHNKTGKKHVKEHIKHDPRCERKWKSSSDHLP